MPASFHNVQIRVASSEPVIELLESDPALSMFEYFIGEGGGWIAVLPQRIDKGVKTARSLSHKLHTDAFSFRTFSQDAFLYSYFRNGEKHDEFCSSPDVLKQLQEMDDEMAAIVLQWEQGDLTADEYRERVAEYLANFDARKARIVSEIDRAVGSSWSDKTYQLISDIVSTEFRGKEADDIVREVLARKFPSARIDRRSSAPSSGGKPASFAHLIGDVAKVERILRTPQPAAAQLEQFAASLGISRATTSFQHELEQPTGLRRLSGPLA
jgi:hypothetical protein